MKECEKEGCRCNIYSVKVLNLENGYIKSSGMTKMLFKLLSKNKQTSHVY